MIPDSFERTVQIPIRVRGNQVELLYGGPIPELQDDTVGSLVVPAFAFRNKELLQQYIRELAGPILAAGTVLLAAVSTDDHKQLGLIPVPEGRCREHHGPFVEFSLKEALELTLRGTKRAALRPCLCEIPALGGEVIASSVNHAYTLISEKFESHRLSHGGNVFRKVFFRDGSDRAGITWRPLEYLRAPREAAIEERVRGWMRAPRHSG